MPAIPTERAQWLATNVLPLEPVMRRWLTRVARAGLEPDDLLQEAYAKLAALDSVEHIHNAKAYLYQILRSLILEHVRHSQVVPIEALAEVDDRNLSQDLGSPERILSGRQELERLSRAIERLPPGCRQVFVLRKFEELSQLEIARRLNLAVSTVEKHLARALRLLLADLTVEQLPDGASLQQAIRREEQHGEP